MFETGSILKTGINVVSVEKTNQKLSLDMASF